MLLFISSSYVIYGRLSSLFLLKCIDPARDCNRVINSLYLSFASQCYETRYFMTLFAHVSSSFFRSSISFPKPSRVSFGFPRLVCSLVHFELSAKVFDTRMYHQTLWEEKTRTLCQNSFHISFIILSSKNLFRITIVIFFNDINNVTII